MSDVEKISSESTSPAPQNDVQKGQRAITGIRWVFALMTIYSCNFLYGLDNTIVADIQAPIIASLGQVEKLGWLGIGFPLGAIAVILPIGKFYGIFDTKWMFFWCLTMFAAGSALCGGAPQMNALIVGRVWAGAGGCGMYLGNINMLATLTLPTERSVYMAGAILVYGVGVILGPVVGGSLADSSASGWRWAFYLNLFIYAVAIPIYIFAVPALPQRAGEKLGQKMRSLDWLGTFLSFAFYTFFALIFTFGGSIWPWEDGRMIAFYVVFAVTFIGFGVTQYFCVFTSKRDRLFPGQFVKEPTMMLLVTSCTALSGALYVLIYYLSLFYALVRGENGVKTAVHLLPFVCFYVTGVMLNGIFMVRWGYYMPWYLASGILTTAGGALFYTSTTDMSDAKIYGYSILLGVGQMTFQAAYSVVPTKVLPEEIPEAIQFINIGQQGSILVALAICNTIFQTVASNRLLELLVPAGYAPQDVTAAISGARSYVIQTASPELRQKAFDILVEAIDDTYILIIISGIMLILCSVFMKREKIVMEIAVGG